MNTRFFWLFGLALIPTISVFGQSKRGPLEGVWQAVEVTHGGAQAITIRPGSDLTIFAVRHYSRINVQAQKPRPVLANAAPATAEQLREVWGPLVAEAGTYELTDNLMTLRPIVAKNPAAMAPGISIVYSYRLDDNMLTFTAQRDVKMLTGCSFSVRTDVRVGAVLDQHSRLDRITAGPSECCRLENPSPSEDLSVGRLNFTVRRPPSKWPPAASRPHPRPHVRERPELL